MEYRAWQKKLEKLYGFPLTIINAIVTLSSVSIQYPAHLVWCLLNPYQVP